MFEIKANDKICFSYNNFHQKAFKIIFVNGRVFFGIGVFHIKTERCLYFAIYEVNY